jgi:hypothetical protein
MSTTAEALRALKRKHDQEDTEENRQREWMEKQFQIFQRLVIDSASNGKTDYYTYIHFIPTKECMDKIKEAFEGCQVFVNMEEKNLNRLVVSWKEEEQVYQEDEEEEFEEEQEEEKEENELVEEEPEYEPAKSDDEIKKRIQDEMYRFFEKNRAYIPMHNKPEWVKNMESRTPNHIPDRGYTWQQKPTS